MSEQQPVDELAQLLIRMEQGELSPEEKEELNRLLREDEAALDQFVRYQSLEALLAWRFAPTPAEEAPQAATISIAQAAAAPSGSVADRASWRGWWLAAAALLMGVVMGYPLGAVTKRDGKAALNEPAPAATLTSVSRDVRWAGTRPLAVGATLEKGWLHLEAGTVELTFSSGATVRLEGPALFAVDSPLRGFLSYGRVRVHAPESARDFSIGATSMEVVDLGTEFDLSVSQQSGAAEIEVREGLVDLHLANAGGANRIQSLSKGQSAKVDEAGKITSLQGDQLDPLLLAHWRLDDDAENALVVDASPHQFHGTLNVPTHDRTQPGKAGRALTLGADGYVDFSPHLKALTETSAFTLAAWVRNADDIVFSVSDGTERQRLQFELHGPWLYYGWQQGDRFDRISAGVPSWERDRWYHVAVSVSGGNVTLYRDGRALIEPRRMGAVLNTRAIAPIDLQHPTAAYLGRVPSNHAQQQQFLGGELDDVQLYGRALDEVAIRYLFEHPGVTLPRELDPERNP